MSRTADRPGKRAVRVLPGDCLAVMARLAARCILVDAIVTDPPYGLHFMGRDWDHGVPGPRYWRAAYRLLRPGGHLLAFGGTRGWHRLASAIEDAGFEIRDTVAWLYGSGFPKSHDIAKAIDKAAGAEREVIATRHDEGKRGVRILAGNTDYDITAPATPAAERWQGWGTALKPAFEPIVLARRPLSEKSVAANVLRHGTGAINVDGCRVAHSEECKTMAPSPANIDHPSEKYGQAGRREPVLELKPEGRWPANVVHDGSEEVDAAFASFGDRAVSGAAKTGRSSASDPSRSGVTSFDGSKGTGSLHNDFGSAARFFYSAKADALDRFGSRHPTVKPVDLMRWLVRLVTPPGGLILDPFAGSGTTGIAAIAEGMRAILIEREAEYVADIRARLAHAAGQGGHRLATMNRNRKPRADLPLFGDEQP